MKTQQTPKPEVKNPTHRYYCDSCTGIAFLHVEGDPVTIKYCKACGINLQPINKYNFIKL